LELRCNPNFLAPAISFSMIFIIPLLLLRGNVTKERGIKGVR